VRDPLGALWPFLGIVIEAIVLAVIIVGYEYYKKKDKEKDRGKHLFKFDSHSMTYDMFYSSMQLPT